VGGGGGGCERLFFKIISY
jgi:hypothetical protein